MKKSLPSKFARTDCDPVFHVTAMPTAASACGDILGGWPLSLLDIDRVQGNGSFATQTLSYTCRFVP